MFGWVGKVDVMWWCCSSLMGMKCMVFWIGFYICRLWILWCCFFMLCFVLDVLLVVEMLVVIVLGFLGEFCVFRFDFEELDIFLVGIGCVVGVEDWDFYVGDVDVVVVMNVIIE